MTLAAIAREFLELPLGLLNAPALPSRTQIDEDKLDELARDIRRNGLLQPMIVARSGDRFEVIAGHRRYLACLRAGVVVAPCLVYATRGDALDAVQYAENRHREELNAADEALWFSELLEGRCGGDVDVLCARLGEKRGYVENRLLLFSGDPVVFEALRDNKIKIGIAQQLNKCTEERYRRYLLHQAIVGGATVAVVSGWIQDWQRQQELVSGHSATPTDAPPPPAVPTTNYFTCVVCGGVDHVHTMQPINVHGHCKLAILDKLLAVYRGEA